MLLGPNVIDIESSLGVLAIPIGADATVYTKSFDLFGGEYFAISYQVTTAGTINITSIQLEQSETRPTTEGSSDADWVIPASMPDIGTTVAAATKVIKALTPISARYGRIKIITGASNTATNTIRMKLSKVAQD